MEWAVVDGAGALLALVPRASKNGPMVICVVRARERAKTVESEAVAQRQEAKNVKRRGARFTKSAPHLTRP